MAAEKKAFTTTPESKSELSKRGPLVPPATTNTKKTVASAPKKAKSGIPK